MSESISIAQRFNGPPDSGNGGYCSGAAAAFIEVPAPPSLDEARTAAERYARLAGRMDAPAVAGDEHIVMAWPIGADGRKRHAGAAVVSPQGRVLAVARALLIEPRAA